MDLKKFLIAGIVAAGAAAAPAFADVGVIIGIGIPLPPPVAVYEAPPAPAYGYVWAPGYWAWFGNRYIWVRGRYIAATGTCAVPISSRNRRTAAKSVRPQWKVIQAQSMITGENFPCRTNSARPSGV